MRSVLAVAAILAWAPVAGTALAQQKGRPSPGFPDAPGRDVFVAKCFQCHGPNMFTAQRQDRKAWESALYRMVGRGALWTEDEIKAMADYLAAVYGRNAK